MKAKKKVKTSEVDRRKTLWIDLYTKINTYAEAAVADSWKGGGDPDDVPVLEMRLKLAHLELDTQIEKMQRDLE